MTTPSLPQSTWVLALAADAATLPVAGGKGASLARLAAAGLPVPAGFHVTTAAYAAFVAAGGLRPIIQAALAGVDVSRPETLDRAAAAIAAAFPAAVFPTEISEAILAAYAGLAGGDARVATPVAVRSSATAEDLPELSFAGQQDTYLNVVGPERLLEAVVSCWASLWTARAIGYRARNGLDAGDLSLAVVVQEMVQSDVSGVLFTADPLTGRRDRTVIDATLGLGEALVSGRVEPDHYEVDAGAGVILGRRLGSKAVTIRGRAGGGTATVVEQAADRQALPDAEILALARLGQRIAALYGAPQDIEWGWAAGRLHVLQARPVTSLYPLPEDVPAGPLQVWLSFGAVQGVLGPLTPCGRDGIAWFMARGGRLFGFQFTARTQRAVVEAGERLFINVTPLMGNVTGRNVGDFMAGVIDEGIGQALDALRDEPGLPPAAGRLSLCTIRRLAPVALPLAGRFVLALWRPAAVRRRAQERAESLVTGYTAAMAAARRLEDRLDVIDGMLAAVPHTLIKYILPAFAPGMAVMNLLFKLAAQAGEERSLVLEITRGLPYNVTTEMDLALWAVAQAIRADPVACARVAGTPVEDLGRAYRCGELPATAQEALAGFLVRYGVHGTAEIDLGRQRWNEDPAPVLQSLQSYLRIEDPDAAPDRVFARGAAAAEQAAGRLAAALRQGPHGRAKAALARFAAGRVRALAGMREYPKFFAVRLLGLTHDALLATGEDLEKQGLLSAAGDVFFLRLDELRELARDAGGDTGRWRALVAERRAAYQREQRRRQIPRVLLSDGRAFYGGVAAGGGAANTLAGTPVSPGMAEGPVRIVFDPHQAQLRPGEILVCPGTDPAWTPLFLAAAGLVMEVGGLMTHGAVVAREYGIPAVASVHEATSRLKTGQRVRVDGSNGVVSVLAPPPNGEGA